MSLIARNKPVTRSRKLILEKKTSKKAEMPKKNTTAVKKKENPKATQSQKPVVNKPTEKTQKAFGNKRLLKNIKLYKPVVKEEIEQKSSIVILPKKAVNTERSKKGAIKIGSSTIIEKIKTPNDEQQKTKDEKIKKKSEPIILNKMRFGQNAHRAIIQDRDSAVIVSPRLNEVIRKTALAEHGIGDSSKVTKVKVVSPAVNNTVKLPASEAIAVGKNKPMIDFICEPDGNTYTSDTSGIIITMTSWPKRINNVEKTLKTILENSVRPEKIIVNLSTEEFPGKESNLPSGLILLAQKNPMIEFHWLKHNTTVWKKIIPTIVRFKNANVICIDDDRLYPKNFIATFKSAISKYPSGPITGANISFYKKFKQHCGHATLDKYVFYKDGLNFITKEVMELRSSDSVLTIIANRTGHQTQYLGTNFLTLIPQNNNPVNGYSSGNKVSVSSAIRNADSMFTKYIDAKQPNHGAPAVNKGLPVTKQAQPSVNNESTNGKPRIALCGLAKNENLYIREWVEYYLKLGVDTIFLYDNNDIDGEKFDEVIPDYILNGKVVICDVRGKEKAFRNATHKLLQETVYEECYNKNKTKYDWFFFFDIDEFLYIVDGNDAKKFLSLPRFKNVTTILVNWKNYGDSGNVRYEDRPVQERFTTPGYDVKWLRPNTQCKTILRGGNKKLTSTHTHKLQIEGSVMSNADGKILNISRIMSLGPEIDAKTYKSAYLKHYVTKTIEEYLIRYTGRGKIGKYNNKNAKDIIKYSLSEVANNFFMINEKTPEKLAVIKEYESGNLIFGQQQKNESGSELTGESENNRKKQEGNKVIVSLTSYKPRLKTLHMVINSLLANTMKPYKIVLTVYKGDETYITKEIRKLEEDGKVEIIITDEDLKPHKKYFYTMQKYPDIPIITVDDDVIYQKNLISLLYNGYLKYPGCVCCLRSRNMSFYNKKIRPYKYWKVVVGKSGPSQLLVPTGVGGVIYPPGYLKNYDIEDIKRFINTDDFYLYYLTIKNGMKNVQLDGLERLKLIDGSQKVALFSTVNNINSTDSGNDKAIKELITNRLIKNETIKP